MIRLSRAEAILLGVWDLFFTAMAFSVAYVLRFWFEVGAVIDVPPPPKAHYGEALVVVLVVFHLVLRSNGLYELALPRGIDVVERVLAAVTFAAVIVLAASFFYREFSYSRSVTVLSWGMVVVMLTAPRIVLQRRRRNRYAKGLGLIPALVVGEGERARDLLRRLENQRYFGIGVRGLVLRSLEGEPEETQDPPVLGDLSRLELAIQSSGAVEVLLTDTLDRLELLEALEVCERLRVSARVVPCVYDLFINESDLTELHGVPFVKIGERRFERLSLVLKRLFDLVVGGVLLLLSLPIVCVLALLIRRESPGPAVFRQRRVGVAGRTFDMCKLRTMSVDAPSRVGEVVDLRKLDEDPAFKVEDDPRVTRLGRKLRRWSLDELPQLWNVVRGDMSLVGPRPEEEQVVAKYDAHHRRRLKAKPGLTGLWQVEARSVTEIDERVRLDVFYLRRRTFLFDLWVLARTPGAVLRGEGAQ